MQNLPWAKTWVRLTCVVASLTVFSAIQAMSASTNDALLDLLLKKGIISQDEATQVQAEAAAQMTNNAPAEAASKWKIGNAIKNVELFGDIRFRYEDRSVVDPAGGSIDLQRLRYALRLGLRGEALDDVYYGIRFETAANPRSPWVTLGSATASSTGQYQGPYGKSGGGISVGQLYLGWRPENWLDITLGKMPMPLYTTPMVWDSDFSPEGAAERFKYTVGEADFFATFAQFLYQDTNPDQTSAGYFPTLALGQHTSPSFLLAWQIGITYHIDKDLSVKVAPMIYNYTGSGSDNNQGNLGTPGFSDAFVGEGQNINLNLVGKPGYSGVPTGEFDGFASDQTGINDLLVLEIPAQIDFKLHGLSARVFGDFAENLDGSARAAAAANAISTFNNGSGTVGLINVSPIPVHSHEDKAYQVGFAIANKDSLGLVYGSLARKNAWEARAYWQHVEQYALDPNLLDSDFFEGRGNLEGFYAALAYGLSDNVIGTLRYGHASRIDTQLGTGGSNQDIPQMNPIEHYEVIQFDLAFRF